MTNIQHTESTVKIYFSRDYSKFHFLKGNRMLDESKIKNIINDIKSGTDFLKYCPIVVNDNMEILDGQHRFYVCKKLDRPVYYILASEVDIKKVAKINSRFKNWSNTNYLDTWISLGYTDYEKLEQFMKEYSITNFKLATSLLQEGGTEYRTIEEFREGEFRIQHEKLARDILEKVKLFSNLILNPTSKFVSAIITIIDGDYSEWELLVSKCEEQKENWINNLSKKDFLNQMESMLNHRMRIRKILY